MALSIRCTTCPINVGCHWECLRGDDLAEIATLREALTRMLDHGHRCNWFADRLDFEIVEHAQRAITGG